MAEAPKRPTPEQINAAYKDGAITAADRNGKMRRLASDNLHDYIGDKGILRAYLHQTISHVQEAWDNYVKLIDEYKPAGQGTKQQNTVGAAANEAITTLENAAYTAWNIAGAIWAPFTAFAEVNGEVAKQWATDAGASPGVAKVIGAVAELGSNFVPIGSAAKGIAKGIQKNVPQLAAGVSKVAKVGKAAGAGAEAATEVKAAAQATKLADDAIAAGLKEEGKILPSANPHFITPGSKPATRAAAFDQLPDDAEVIVFHATDEKTAASILKRGLFASEKPVKTGEGFGPGSGLDRGAYVGSDPVSVSGYGKNIVGLRVKKSQISVPSEGKSLNPNRTVGEAIANGDAIITGDISRQSVFSVPGNPYRTAIEALKDLNESPDFYSALRKYHGEIKDITETKHLKDIQAEADKLGMHLDDLKALGQGTPLTPAQIKAYLDTLDEPTKNMVEAAKGVLKNEPGAAGLFDRLQTEYFNYTPKFRAAEVEAGRTVKVLDADPRMKSITEMMKAWQPEAMASLDINAARKLMAEDWVALAGNLDKIKALQLQAATGAVQKGPTFWTQLREAYTNLLLARPVTQVRNFLGNMFAATNSAVERELAGWLSIDKANGVVKGEGVAQLQGYTTALGEGIQAFGDAFKRGGAVDIGKFDYMPHSIPGPLGRIINIPGDALRGMDNFFKVILRRGDLYAQALNQGRHMGLDGRALTEYATTRANVPTVAMMQHATDFALEQTFQNDLGTLGKAAQKIGQFGPFVYWFPFMKTPMNLAKYAWNRTPGLQFISSTLYQDILAGGTRADMAIGRLTLSNMMAAFWFSLHRQGVITDGGPIDPTLRRSWLATHQPYSFRGRDGTWYPLPQMEPATTSINLITDFSAIMNQLGDPSAEQAAMAITLAGLNDIASKTYWQSASQILEMVSSARVKELSMSGQTGSLIESPVLSATTGGPLMQSMRNIEDPVRREARSFVDRWMARVPGYSKELPPMRDGYGDPILPPAALGSDWLQIVSPFTFKPQEEDKIKQEGAKLQVKLPMFPWSLGGATQDNFDVRAALPGDKLPVPLSPEQRDRWQVLYRNILRSPEAGVSAVMNSEEYQNAPWAMQRDMFMNALASARSAAKDILLAEDPELAKAAIKSEASGVLPLLNPEQRPEVEQQYNDAADLMQGLSPEEQDSLMKWGFTDPGTERDQEVIRGFRGEINKSIPDLNQREKLKLTIHEYFANGMWDVSGEMGDGPEAIQYFHSSDADHDKALEEVKAQAKTFKTYDVDSAPTAISRASPKHTSAKIATP